MKILIAPDSFKDALPALQVCEAVRLGVQRALPDAEVQLFPLADGGDGTAEVLAWHLPGRLVKTTVHDPLMRPIQAQYFLAKDGAGVEIAFIEMAQASGLQLLSEMERNPLETSTFGTGELLLSALENGAKNCYLAVGGSATNDAGMGMAAALGWRFLDENGVTLAPIGENLLKVVKVLPPNPKPAIANPMLLADVTNPLYGPYGAAHVFAPQKGADAAAVALLDAGLRHFAGVIEQTVEQDFSQVPGAGAAGGLGFGAMAFLGASMQSGALTILELVGFEQVASGCDLVITGEGKLDGQTQQGKLVAAVSQKAGAMGVPVMAICGAVEATPAEVAAMGLSGAFELRRQGEALSDSIARTAISLEETAYKVLKTMQL